VTAIFVLIPGLVFALAAVGMVWIRLAAAEYRHNWSVSPEVSHGAYRGGESAVTDRVSRRAMQPR
jgi:hypothetical protein